MMSKALSSSEWQELEVAEPFGRAYLTKSESGDDRLETDDGVMSMYGASFTSRRHALAALALHNQPFGFTRQDVTFLRSIMADLNMPGTETLADRIEALLPHGITHG